MPTIDIPDSPYTVASSKSFKSLLDKLSKRAAAVGMLVPMCSRIYKSLPFTPGILECLQDAIFAVAELYVDPNVDYAAAHFTNFPVYYTPGRVTARHRNVGMHLPGTAENMFDPEVILRVEQFVSDAEALMDELHIVTAGGYTYCRRVSDHYGYHCEPYDFSVITNRITSIEYGEREKAAPDYPSKQYKTGYSHRLEHHYGYDLENIPEKEISIENQAPFDATLHYYLVGSTGNCQHHIYKNDPGYGGVESPNRAGTGTNDTSYVPGYAALENFRYGNGYKLYNSPIVEEYSVGEFGDCYAYGASQSCQFSLNPGECSATFNYIVTWVVDPTGHGFLSCKQKEYKWKQTPTEFKFSITKEEQERQHCNASGPFGASTGADVLRDCWGMMPIHGYNAFGFVVTERCPTQVKHPWFAQVNKQTQVDSKIPGVRAKGPSLPTHEGTRYYSHCWYDGRYMSKLGNDRSKHYWRKDVDINEIHTKDASWCNEETEDVDWKDEKSCYFIYTETLCFVDLAPSKSGSIGSVAKNKCRKVNLTNLVVPGSLKRTLQGITDREASGTAYGSKLTSCGNGGSWSLPTASATATYNSMCDVGFYFDYTF